MRNCYLTVFLCLTLLFTACKKAAVDPLSQLPPATQTGADTFGCLVNGQVFLPHANFLTGDDMQCTYGYNGGSYSLLISASNDSNTAYIADFELGTTALPINQGQTLTLQNYNQPGQAFGEYILIQGSPYPTYRTTTVVNGSLYISKFDQVNRIISGTFSFNAINQPGDTVHVTDGRFDMAYL